MTLQEMIQQMEGSFGLRLQAKPREILSALDAAQKAAFSHDCRAFQRTAELSADGSFPEDAREIISVWGISSYEVDFIRRKIIFTGDGGSVRYYLRPETLTGTETSGGDIEFSPADEAKVIVPDEWRWPVLAVPATALLDSGLYGDKAPQEILEKYFKEWWQAMDARPNDRQPIDSVGAW